MLQIVIRQTKTSTYLLHAISNKNLLCYGWKPSLEVSDPTVYLNADQDPEADPDLAFQNCCVTLILVNKYLAYEEFSVIEPLSEPTVMFLLLF